MRCRGKLRNISLMATFYYEESLFADYEFCITNAVEYTRGSWRDTDECPHSRQQYYQVILKQDDN